MQELLTRCRSGEANAIEAFVIKLHPWALRYANSMLGDYHLAEDATQEALIVAITRLGDLREDAAVYAWLRQIIRTQVNRLQRIRTVLVLGDTSIHASTTASPQAEQEAGQLRQMVRQSVAQLPGKGRETVELFYLKERSITEVSRSLGIPVGTVKRRLHDARKLLGGIFCKWGLQPEITANSGLGKLTKVETKVI